MLLRLDTDRSIDVITPDGIRIFTVEDFPRARYTDYVAEIMDAVRTAVNRKASKPCQMLYDVYHLLD